MRIAFTFNLQLNQTESEAEFDTVDTVTELERAMRSLGHEVVLIEASREPWLVIQDVRAARPDLVFNTVEGRRGTLREALYPALLEELGVAFTGSDAWTCALTLDKHLTKIVAKGAGVRVPDSWLIRSVHDLSRAEVAFPVIVKPNTGGSSQGITQDSIVEQPDLLLPTVAACLQRFADGALIEQYIAGRDVVVPYLAGLSPATGGILEPATYRYRDQGARRHSIYDLELKLDGFDGLEVEVPGTLTTTERQHAIDAAAAVVHALGVRDFARLDFRLDAAGQLYFLEINALPSLERGASIYLSAALVGAPRPIDVIEAIIASARPRVEARVSSHPPWNAASEAVS